MKDYIKSKIKRTQKYSVIGHWPPGDEAKDRARERNNLLQGNANRISETFNQLASPLAADLLLATSKLESVDLISDGPIEGFFDQEGKKSTALEAIYLNDVPVVERAKTKTTTEFLSMQNLSGCFMDYTTGVRNQLMEYRDYLSTGILITGRKLDLLNPAFLQPTRKKVITIKMDFESALTKTHNDSLIGCTFSQPSAIDDDGNSITDIGEDVPNGGSFFSGAGYRRAPYAQVNYYGQDEISELNMIRIPTRNVCTVDRPKKYQGSYMFGNGLNEKGGYIENAFTTRAFWTVLQGYHSIKKQTDADTSLFVTGYAAQIFFSGFYWGVTGWDESTDGENGTKNGGSANGGLARRGPLVTGTRPYDIYHSFLPGSEKAEGLIEPHLNNIKSLIDQLPNEKVTKYYLFNQAHENKLSNRFGGYVVSGGKVDTFQGKKNVFKIGGFKAPEDATNNFNYLGFFNNREKNNFPDNNFNLQNFPGAYEFSEATGFHTYRFTGSYYIPAGSKCSGITFWQNGLIGAVAFDARSTMDQWVDFDASYTQTPDNVAKNATGNFVVGLDNFGSEFTNKNLARWDNKDAAYFHNLSIAREDVSYNEFVGNSTGYLLFNAKQNFGEIDHKIQNQHELKLALDTGTFYSNSKESLKYVLPEITGFSGISRNIKESICREIDGDVAAANAFGDSVSRRRRRQVWTITGNSVAYPHNVELVEKPFVKFRGAFMWPVYLGENNHAMSGVSDGNMKRVMIFSDDDDGVAEAKLNSGIKYGYDVFSANSDGRIKYSHLANPNVNQPSGEITGRNLQIKLEEKQLETFNFTNIKVQTTLGEENQKPIVSGSRAFFVYSNLLLGPYSIEAEAPTGVDLLGMYKSGQGGTLDVTNTGNELYADLAGNETLGSAPITGEVYNPSFSSHDINISGISSDSNASDFDSSFDNFGAPGEIIDFADWRSPASLSRDDTSTTHIVTKREIDKISVSLTVHSLFSKNIRYNDAKNPKNETDRASAAIEVEMGFENVTGSHIYQPIRKRINIQGIAFEPYPFNSDDFDLPKYSDLINAKDDADNLIFPNESLKSLSEKHKRYVTVRKLDYETDSTKVNREIEMYAISEILNTSFSYPNSALAKVGLDARTFNDIPNRTYNVRLKKVLVPSNYTPLDNEGVDKRFIKNANDLGTRVIYDGDWDGALKSAWTDNPAWILYDLLINNRYGLGSRLDDLEDINIFNLYKIGRYCDAVNDDGNFVGISDGLGGLEPRFSCNILIDSADNAFEIINQIATVFNGKPFWSNGSIDFYSDRPVDVSAFFNNGNVFDGRFDYQDVSKSSNFNVVEVQFQDREDDFRIKVESLEDEDGIRRDGKIVRKVNGRGTTSRGQARRLGRYILYSNKLEREIVGFKAGSESLMLNVGEVISINDELKNFEIDYAKILEVNENDSTIAIENTININSIDNNSFVYAPSGQTGQADLYNEIAKGGLVNNQRLNAFDAPQISKIQIASTESSGNNAIKLNLTNTSGQTMSLLKTDSYININLKSRSQETYRVLKITPEQDNLYSIEATQYNSGKFNFIERGDEDFNLSQETPYNIGVLENEIKQITEPISFSHTKTQNNVGNFDLNFTINGDTLGTEEKYLITVVLPNGIRKEKRVLKGTTTAGGFIVTTVSFKNLYIYGTHNVFVKSIE